MQFHCSDHSYSTRIAFIQCSLACSVLFSKSNGTFMVVPIGQFHLDWTANVDSCNCNVDSATWPESAVNIRRTTFFELPFSPGRLLIPDVYSWGHGVKYAFVSDWHSSREVARSIDIRTFLHINGWFDDRNVFFFFYGPGNPLWKSGALKMHSEGWFFFANSIHGWREFFGMMRLWCKLTFWQNYRHALPFSISLAVTSTCWETQNRVQESLYLSIYKCVQMHTFSHAARLLLLDWSKSSESICHISATFSTPHPAGFLFQYNIWNGNRGESFLLPVHHIYRWKYV